MVLSNSCLIWLQIRQARSVPNERLLFSHLGVAEDHPFQRENTPSLPPGDPHPMPPPLRICSFPTRQVTGPMNAYMNGCTGDTTAIRRGPRRR